MKEPKRNVETEIRSKELGLCYHEVREDVAVSKR